MSAAEMLRDGKLSEALTFLKKEVSADPANVKHRIFLFQLLCVLGQWDQALTQLNVAVDLDPITLAMAQMYREALSNEALRAEVFQGKRQPMIFGEPPEWMGLLLEALRLSATGDSRAGEELRVRAFDAASTSSGMIDDTPFEWISDADPRLGPVIEVIVNGRYYWIPFSNISEIRIEAPADLRDTVWTPCQFIWSNGGDAVGVIPTRYPASESSEDDLIRLARKTDWQEQPDGPPQGLGQRLFAIDSGDLPIMDTRLIRIDSNVEGATTADSTVARGNGDG